MVVPSLLWKSSQLSWNQHVLSHVFLSKKKASSCASTKPSEDWEAAAFESFQAFETKCRCSLSSGSAGAGVGWAPRAVSWWNFFTPGVGCPKMSHCRSFYIMSCCVELCCLHDATIDSGRKEGVQRLCDSIKFNDSLRSRFVSRVWRLDSCSGSRFDHEIFHCVRVVRAHKPHLRESFVVPFSLLHMLHVLFQV